ncbi:helix-turn-helix transcriptional regulator [Pseudomonas sp. NPDC098740]|uniref:helix-turn-helix transcriptional regulator n=1 Tax=Pseudomonas sp. NPDC098740 TaxID=3364486 RepID=UPI00383BA3EC
MSATYVTRRVLHEPTLPIAKKDNSGGPQNGQHLWRTNPLLGNKVAKKIGRGGEKHVSKLDRFLKERDVIEVTSLSHATLWRSMKRGDFPKPVSISPGRVGWRESAIIEWQKNPKDWKPNDVV